jgi:hypothetical protein
VFLWERLGAASPGPVNPYLADFVTKKAAPKPPARPVKAAAAKRGSKAPRGAPSGDSLATILSEVHSAVEGVSGSRAEDEQPLMEAGLDSLGEDSESHVIKYRYYFSDPKSNSERFSMYMFRKG